MAVNSLEIELTDGKITVDTLGNADILEGLDAEIQIIRNALLIYKGGWSFDLTVGVDWLNILDKKYSISTIKSEIKRVLLSLGVIDKIINVSLSDANPDRSATLTLVVTTVSGNTITISEVL